ncbi:hypothetical protein ABLE68_16370 [Nocardioides sp. CN2-186]|uniref:hypothetical protein n=1 Tax=Nocardioides tweenelious TaxID=3156607 RepID=UPI0032B3CCA5
MTISLALHELRDATARLSEAVTELVMIAHEDRPDGSEVAAVDSFAEQVSELQSAVVTAGRVLAAVDGTDQLARRMADVDAAIASAALRYWRDLRSYDATAAMRQAARRGRADWRAWQVSIEQSQERCEQPLLEAVTRARAVWLELAELVSLWLAHGPITIDAGGPASENTRRST